MPEVSTTLEAESGVSIHQWVWGQYGRPINKIPQEDEVGEGRKGGVGEEN